MGILKKREFSKSSTRVSRYRHMSPVKGVYMTWKLGSGEAVVDRHQSHLHTGVASLFPEALAHIDARGRKFLVEEVDFGRLIGETVCVATNDADEIVYAQRLRRAGLSRFVKNRVAAPCAAVVVILKRDDLDMSTYVLISAFVGHKSEPEPWDRNATPQSVAFWNSHALIWGSEPIVSGTETATCTW